MLPLPENESFVRIVERRFQRRDGVLRRHRSFEVLEDRPANSSCNENGVLEYGEGRPARSLNTDKDGAMNTSWNED
jgi:hypothetical protein